MENFTPMVTHSLGEQIEADGIAQNLFKNTPVPPAKDEKLQTFLRIRPLKEEQERPFTVVNSKTLVADPPMTSRAFKVQSNNSDTTVRRKYTFDHIFGESVNQAEFFDKCALPQVLKFMRGESTLLFAYGTTSSGKSFTMQGTAINPGVIPRAVETIFKCLDSADCQRIEKAPIFKPSRFCEALLLKDEQSQIETLISSFIFNDVQSKTNSVSSLKNLSSIPMDITSDMIEDSNVAHPSNIGLRYNIWVSFVEFYNDQVKDLLAVDIPGERQPQLLIISDGNNNYFLKGIRHVFCATPEDALKALVYGQENLHIAGTVLNKQSSRSHCVFNISLVAFDDNAQQFHRVSNLSFCDLAGSERGNRTQNTGERLREAGKINGTLLSLRKCINTLRDNQKKGTKDVVPFRECNITKMFQSYFNGNATSSMILNINPSIAFYDETLNTLTFSNVASKVVISNEDSRRRQLQESANRLTQVWMQSTQRWSTFAHQRPNKASISAISSINGSVALDTDGEESADGDFTLQDMESLQSKLEELSTSRVDLEQIEFYQKQIDFLTERLSHANNEKLEFELKIRSEVAAEFRKISEQLTQENSEDNSRAKKNMEVMLKKKTEALEVKFSMEAKKLRQEYLQKENDMNKQLEECEKQIADVASERDSLLSKISELEQIVRSKEVEILSLLAQRQMVNSVEQGVSTSCVATTERDTSCSDLEAGKSLMEQGVNTTISTTDCETSCSELSAEKCSVEQGVNTSTVVTIEMSTSCSESIVGESFNKVSDDINDESPSLLVEQSISRTSVDSHANLEDKAVNTSMVFEAPATEVTTVVADKAMERELKELRMLLKITTTDHDNLKGVMGSKDKKIGELTQQNLELRKQSQNQKPFLLTNSKNPFALPLIQPKRAETQPTETEAYIKHLVKDEKDSNRKRPATEPAETESVGDDTTSELNEDELTADTFKSQKKLRKTSTRAAKKKKDQGHQENSIDSVRRKIPKNKSLLNSISPISQDEDVVDEVVSNTGRKLRSRRQKVDCKEKDKGKTTKRALF